jgi:hypothetical protein
MNNIEQQKAMEKALEYKLINTWKKGFVCGVTIMAVGVSLVSLIFIVF